MRTVTAWTIVAACVAGAAGCGDDKKTVVATKLDQPLPPAPVGSGGTKPGKAAPGGPTNKVE